MSRESSNCSVTRVLPSEELDVISVTPAMRPRARSSGVATVAAITSGLAPGSDADTDTVGKSTCGSGETGSSPKATAPASATPIESSVVATGRRTKGSVRFIRRPPELRAARVRGCAPALRRVPGGAVARRQAIEVEIDHGRGEEREQLREDEAAHHRDAERMAHLRAHAPCRP